MIGFESFSVTAWYENGLTRHVPVPRVKSLGRVGSKIATAVMTGALTLSAPMSSVFAAPIEVSGTTMTSVRPPPQAEVPVGYWPSLMKEIASWESVAEPDFEYPDED